MSSARREGTGAAEDKERRERKLTAGRFEDRMPIVQTRVESVDDVVLESVIRRVFLSSH